MPDPTFKNYFLGSLSDDDASEIELRILEDEEFAAEISIAEEDLIEAFLSGELSTEDSTRFRINYLVTDERIKNVEMTALMLRYASQNIEKTTEVDNSSSQESGFFQWFYSLGLGLRSVAVSVAVILVITSLWFVLRPQRDNELIALQNRYEKINQDPSSDSLTTRLSELSLVSGNLRASGSMSELSRTDLTENVRFRIALPSQTDNSTSYDVTILRDTIEVFRQNNIRPLANSTVPELRLLLPRAIFSVGNYRLELQTGKAPNLSYYFVVR